MVNYLCRTADLPSLFGVLFGRLGLMERTPVRRDDALLSAAHGRIIFLMTRRSPGPSQPSFPASGYPSSVLSMKASGPKVL